MELIHLIYDHPQNPWLGGGAALRAKAVSAFLGQKGDIVHFVSGGFPGQINEEPHIQNHFTSCSKRYLFSRLLFSLKAGSVVKKLKKSRKIDKSPCITKKLHIQYKSWRKVVLNDRNVVIRVTNSQKL